MTDQILIILTLGLIYYLGYRHGQSNEFKRAPKIREHNRILTRKIKRLERSNAAYCGHGKEWIT